MKKLLLAIIMPLMLAVALPAPAYADSHCADPAIPAGTPCPSPTATTTTNKQAVCDGVGFAGGSGNCNPGSQDSVVSGVVTAAINLISVVVGIISVIMIIIGGLKYIISTGDAGKIDSAKNTILYAVIGLVVVALAQVIVRFVLSRV